MWCARMGRDSSYYAHVCVHERVCLHTDHPAPFAAIEFCSNQAIPLSLKQTSCIFPKMEGEKSLLWLSHMQRIMEHLCK